MFEDLNTYDLSMWMQKYWEGIRIDCFGMINAYLGGVNARL